MPHYGCRVGKQWGKVQPAPAQKHDNAQQVLLQTRQRCSRHASGWALHAWIRRQQPANATAHFHRCKTSTTTHVMGTVYCNDAQGTASCCVAQHSSGRCCPSRLIRPLDRGLLPDLPCSCWWLLLSSYSPSGHGTSMSASWACTQRQKGLCVCVWMLLGELENSPVNTPAQHINLLLTMRELSTRVLCWVRCSCLGINEKDEAVCTGWSVCTV